MNSGHFTRIIYITHFTNCLVGNYVGLLLNPFSTSLWLARVNEVYHRDASAQGRGSGDGGTRTSCACCHRNDRCRFEVRLRTDHSFSSLVETHLCGACVCVCMFRRRVVSVGCVCVCSCMLFGRRRLMMMMTTALWPDGSADIPLMRVLEFSGWLFEPNVQTDLWFNGISCANSTEM